MQLMKTEVGSICYDFDAQCGVLYMHADCCCDMDECVKFFERIDPAIKEILTMAGHLRDTVYRKYPNGWEAFSS